MKLSELEACLNQLLDISRFHDYCPNGLQVEGRSEVFTIVSGVTASVSLLQAAIAANADAVLVHHGYFWRGENPCLTGIRKNRVALLLNHDISLLGYHLPLDAHATLGNNSQLAKKLGLIETGRFGNQGIAAYGTVSHTMTLQTLADTIEHLLLRKPLVIGNTLKPVNRIAWCTGAAQDSFEEAIRLGVDVFLTGEISEHNVHTAHESGVAFISAGHHATERYGIKALGNYIEQHWGISHTFIDIDSPV